MCRPPGLVTNDDGANADESAGGRLRDSGRSDAARAFDGAVAGFGWRPDYRASRPARAGKSSESPQNGMCLTSPAAAAAVVRRLTAGLQC